MDREKLTINVNLDRVYALSLDDDLGIDRAKINDELAEQPSKYAWYATLYEMARNKANICKSQIDTYQAELDRYYREEAAKAGTKITEAGIKAKIDSNDRMNELIDNFNDALKEQGLLFVAVNAFVQRKDMLISIASNMRQEWDSDLRINKEAVRAKIDAMRSKS